MAVGQSHTIWYQPNQMIQAEMEEKRIRYINPTQLYAMRMRLIAHTTIHPLQISLLDGIPASICLQQICKGM